MSNYAQMRTVQGGLASFRCHFGTAPVCTARIYRHHGDHVAGNMDSWFVEVTIKLNEGNHIAVPSATLRAHEEHGIPKHDACQLVAQILFSGKINLRHWRVEHY